MTHRDNEELHGKQEDEAVDPNKVEETRRRLMTKLVAGAFAVPTVLVKLNTTAAHASP
jgi:hypothetical protein